MSQERGSPNGEQPALSYFALRTTVGLVAFSLPVALGITGLIEGRMQSSLSAYYYTGAGTYFTATLAVVGVFLIVYRLGDLALERLATTLAGVAALGVAFFHTAPAQGPTHAQLLLGRVHLVCAATCFLLLGLISLWCFTKNPSCEELQHHRIRWYRVCGALILASILLTAGWNELGRSFFNQNHLLFWLETVCVISFATAFVLKGAYIPRHVDNVAGKVRDRLRRKPSSGATAPRSL